MSSPPPPPGLKLSEVVPQSHQEARDTVLRYLKRTLAALPVGTVFDSSPFGSSGLTAWCEDEPSDPDTAPVSFSNLGNVRVPNGIEPESVIARVGEAWRAWGWYVFERDGFRKPNMFGYASDGYRLQIEMPNPPTYPPTSIAISPCFVGNLDFDGTFPNPIAAH